MTLGNLLTPWFLLAAVLILLVYVEKWVHSHLYGVGWLLTNDKKSATALYYVLLFPGVFVHEFTQYLIAGALNVKIKRVIAWPDAQDDGTLRLDFVQIHKNTHWVSAAIIGASPLFVGLALVWVISNHVLNLEGLLTAISQGDLTLLGPALKNLVSTQDFFLWLYLVFAISNAMLPTPSDRQGWPLVFGLFAGVIVFLVAIGVGDVLLETFTGPVGHGVERLATAFATVIVIEVPGIVIIGFLEEVLERLTKRKFQYRTESAPRRRSRSREPGSNTPLSPDAPMPSIYNLELPLPLPTQQRVDAARRRSQRPAASSPPRERTRPEPAPGAAQIPPGAPRRSHPPADTPAPARTERLERPAASSSARPIPTPAASQTDTTDAQRRSPFSRSRPQTPSPSRSPAQPSPPERSPAAPGESRPGVRRDVPRSPTSRGPARPDRAVGPSDAPPGRSPIRPETPRPVGDQRPERPFGRPAPTTPPGRSAPRPASPFERSPRPTSDRPRPASPFLRDDEDEDEVDDVEYVPFDDIDSDVDLDDF